MTIGIWDRLGGRPFLLAVAVFNAITGAAAALILAPLSFGTDALALRDAANALVAGSLDSGFLYPPLMSLVGRPLTWISPEASAIAMTTVGVLIVVAGVAVETRSLAVIDRVLILVATMTALPVVNELLLGQVTLVIAATVYPLRERDGFVRAVPLGIVLAIMPKPMMLPLLVWLLLRRSRALASVVAVAGALTLGAILVLGIDPHLVWLEALQDTRAVHVSGNISVWSDGSTPAAIAAAVLIVVTFVVALRHEAAGFIAALAAGVLLAPWSLLYALSILGVAVRPALRLMPVRARFLALTVNPASIALPFWWAACWLTVVVPSAVKVPRRIAITDRLHPQRSEAGQARSDARVDAHLGTEHRGALVPVTEDANGT
jgi:hypothetical protein